MRNNRRKRKPPRPTTYPEAEKFIDRCPVCGGSGRQQEIFRHYKTGKIVIYHPARCQVCRGSGQVLVLTPDMLHRWWRIDQEYLRALSSGQTAKKEIADDE